MGLAASGTTGSISLTWSAVAGASGYNVYRETGYNQPLFQPIGLGLATAGFTDSPVPTGTTNYYKVTALSSSTGAESTPSGEASATALSAPVGVAAQPGNGQASLVWNLLLGATGYSVYRGTSAGGEGATAVQTGLTEGSYRDNTLSVGTTYFYQVTATSPRSQSARSAEVSATGVSGPPGSTNLTLTVGNAQVFLTWTASAGATSYTVYRGLASGQATSYQTGLTGTAWTDNAVTNGTTYFYQVTAVSAGGESARSWESGGRPLAPPVAPSYLSATATGTASNQLYWGVSGNAASYKVERSPDGSV